MSHVPPKLMILCSSRTDPAGALYELDNFDYRQGCQLRGTEAAAMSVHSVLDAVARRLESEPQRVIPTLRLLADPDAVPDVDDTETVELARKVNAERIAERRAEFRAHAVPTAEVRNLLGVTRQAIASRVANHTLLALQIAGTAYFPDWQFGPDGTLPGLNRVVVALTEQGRGALAVDALMRNPLPEENGRSPAQLLATGDVDRVLHYVVAAGSGF
jgi:hypothetical protein